MSGFNAESMDGLCQMFDTERMERIQPASEIMYWHDAQSFFSPAFKTSKAVIDYILKKYSSRGSGMQAGLITRYEIQRNISLYKNYADRFEKINSEQEVRMKFGNILAHFDDKYGTGCIYMLSADRLLSDYRDDSGRYINCRIEDLKIEKHHIYNRNGYCLVSGSSFSEEFMNLFQELSLLEKRVEVKGGGSHPILKEGRMTRARYLEILIDKCFFDGYLSANEVIRLEIMARQFGISSSLLEEEMKKAIGRSKSKNALECAVQKINDIPKGYYYALIQDLIALETECLVLDYENRETISEFLKRVAVRCGFEESSVDKWFKVIHDFMLSSYNLESSKFSIKK